MSSSRVPVCRHLCLLAVFVFSVSGVQRLTVTPERGTSLNLRASQVKGSTCKVCTVARGGVRHCSTSLLLKDSSPVSVEFDCPAPQDVFSVEVVRNIECTTRSCSGDIVQVDSDIHPFLDFNRSFTWNLTAAFPKAVQVEFTNMGLRQIDPSTRCPDRHTYTLRSTKAAGTVVIGTFCRGGAISSAQILNPSSFSLDVPAGVKLQNAQFHVSVGEDMESLARMKLSLPPGPSSFELFSPNYPLSFPDDDVMEWYFQDAAEQRASVQFLNLTQPRCLKKETAVEYHSRGRGAVVLRLTETQPVQTQGNFSLTLKNCVMDRRRADSAGLSLKLHVSASRASPPVLCPVDLRRMKGLSLRIDKLTANSECEMKMDSETKETIDVPSDRVTQLSFQDCLPGDLRVSAVRVIGCRPLDCPKLQVPLMVPSLPSCLPAPLSSVTWSLRPPEHGTVELYSYVPLKQDLPGQPCNDSVIRVSQDDGTTVGHFCPQGVIQKVQVHSNVSVTVTGAGKDGLRPSLRPVLGATFKEEISETYIITVSPKRDMSVLLATPGWPLGMKSYSTVSWMVSLPPNMEAHLMFANLSQPKCSHRHTNIKVQRFGRPEEDYSRREDEEAESEITVSEGFYLNMSNCMPERGDFSVVTKITLQKSQSLLLTIIVSVVAVLLVVLVTVLAVVCVVIRKKKKKLNHQVSIYNPNGTSFLPGQHQDGLPKSSEDEYHVYASIEDTLVYTHLLRKGQEMGVYGETDTYGPFTGHTDSQNTPLSKNAGTDSMDVGVYREYCPSAQQPPPLPNRPPSHSLPMVDNAIYRANSLQEEECDTLGQREDPEGGD